MLAQFQARYPTGSLISELITIYQGKFVVRVAAQVEGVTRATGMAAAETLELAEDQARNRALAVLAITPAAPEPAAAAERSPIPASTSPTQQRLTFNQSDELDLLDYGALTATPPDNESTPSIDAPEDRDPHKTYIQDVGGQLPLTPAPTPPPPPATDFERPAEPEPDNTSKATTASNVTPFAPRNYSTPTSDQIIESASEPIDLSDAIAQTDVELARLRWSKQYGRDYLIRTYNKRSRQQLARTELLEFLDYLKSQPSP